MTTVIVRHKVNDYTKWKRAFDAVKKMRKVGGEKSFKLYRSVKNPKEVFFIGKWTTIASAKKFFSAAALKKAMKEAGVAEKPDIYFVKEA